ncbi:hypothetical protein AOA80_06040 [Methanomassiliicoccales archaeon RumEn M1]|nr:hypothetical protein AOA80_06040 [Methanomassiliicoccales archaeon RumEn M1]
MPPEQRELYLSEAEDFEETLNLLERDLQAERATLVKKLDENIWLSCKDREDMLDLYDTKTRTMSDMRRMLQEIRDLVVSEEPQTH